MRLKPPKTKWVGVFFQFFHQFGRFSVQLKVLLTVQVGEMNRKVKCLDRYVFVIDTCLGYTTPFTWLQLGEAPASLYL